MRIEPNNSSGAAHYAIRAYGAQGAGPIAKIQPRGTASAPQAADGSDQRVPDQAQRLVGAVVPGRVDFSQGAARQVNAGPSLQMYHNPADRNAAATGVSVGRRLDVQG